MADHGLSLEELTSRLDSLPRIPLASLPTGLQPLPRLAAEVGVAQMYVKRDDLTGLGLGGNKSRELEYILAEAQHQGCDVFIAGGGGEQSNHAVQCTAGATAVGMDSIIVLRRRPGPRDNGNMLLNGVLGAHIEWIESDANFTNRTQTSDRMAEIAAELARDGRRPYVLESSLHPLSVVSYVKALAEIHGQLPAAAREEVHLYVTSEGATLGGLLLGVELLDLPWRVTGIDWRPRPENIEETIASVIADAARLLDVPNPVRAEDIRVLPGGGPSYGVGSDESWNAIARAAQQHALLLDPVYTAKGFAGMLSDLTDNPPEATSTIVFVHTGGLGALFAYAGDLQQRVVQHGRHITTSHQRKEDSA